MRFTLCFFVLILMILPVQAEEPQHPAPLSSAWQGMPALTEVAHLHEQLKQAKAEIERLRKQSLEDRQEKIRATSVSGQLMKDKAQIEWSLLLCEEPAWAAMQIQSKEQQ